MELRGVVSQVSSELKFNNDLQRAMKIWLRQLEHIGGPNGGLFTVCNSGLSQFFSHAGKCSLLLHFKASKIPRRLAQTYHGHRVDTRYKFGTTKRKLSFAIKTLARLASTGKGKLGFRCRAVISYSFINISLACFMRSGDFSSPGNRAKNKPTISHQQLAITNPHQQHAIQLYIYI